MTPLLELALVALVCALIPACLFLDNFHLYAAPPELSPQAAPARVSVLIPARDEEQNIAAALAAVLASTAVELEVLVLDDESTDATAAIVRRIAAHDPRVTLLSSHALPAGWNGKQHACWQLAQRARQPLLLFLDADVRVAPEAIVRMALFQQRSGAALVSGFPRLITVSPLEWLLLPLIHFVLLGLLPMRRMRHTSLPAYAAGCGQFLLADREAYFRSGGHQAIRRTLHDGLLLPQLFRRAGLRTDLADLTALAHVRMYASAPAVWQGLAKNATEGLASPALIGPITFLLLCGQVLPAVLAAVLLLRVIASSTQPLSPLLAAAIILSVLAAWLPRLFAAHRFRQPLKSAVLHPVGTTLLLCVQWFALLRRVFGKPVAWRQRVYLESAGPAQRRTLRSKIALLKTRWTRGRC